MRHGANIKRCSSDGCTSHVEERNWSVFSSLLVDDKWVETARIRAPVGISYFGGSVALSGGHVMLSSETSLYSYFLSCI